MAIKRVEAGLETELRGMSANLAVSHHEIS